MSTSDISDASDLLATARETFLAKLLPTLPQEYRYAGRMVANAMAIAARECAQGNEAARSEAARLRELMTELAAPADAVASDVTTWRRIVAGAIRAGRFDDSANERAVTAALLAIAADWVAISNPKALRESR